MNPRTALQVLCVALALWGVGWLLASDGGERLAFTFLFDYTMAVLLVCREVASR